MCVSEDREVYASSLSNVIPQTREGGAVTCTTTSAIAGEERRALNTLRRERDESAYHHDDPQEPLGLEENSKVERQGTCLVHPLYGHSISPPST